MPHKTFVARI